VTQVILADPLREGHRVQNALSLATAAGAFAPLKVTLMVHPWVAEQVIPALGRSESRNVEVTAFDVAADGDFGAGAEGLARARGILDQAAAKAASLGAGLVHLMHLEPFLAALNLHDPAPRGVRWSGLLYSAAAHYPSAFGARLTLRRSLAAQARHALVKRLLRRRNFAFVQTDDPYYLDYLASPKARLVPEHSTSPPAEVRPDDLAADWAARPFRILSFGALSRRHGIFELCDALDQLPVEGAQVGVLFGGRGAEADRDAFASRLDQLRVRRPDIHVSHLPRFLLDEEIQWAVSRASMVAIPYQRLIGSSSVMCWAARAGVPVLAQDWGLLGKVVADNHLGLTVDTTDPAAIARGLGELMNGRVNGFDPGSAQAFARANSAEAFASTYLAQLAEAV
jgi:glycosyltransferase involved in cell wall biosynthesis